MKWGKWRNVPQKFINDILDKLRNSFTRILDLKDKTGKLSKLIQFDAIVVCSEWKKVKKNLQPWNFYEALIRSN